MSEPVAPLTARRLTALVSREQATARVPSLVAGVVREGGLAWTGTRGGHTGGAPPGVDTQYRIGSLTKTMTAVLVLQLRDEGALDLNDPVAAHLPGLAHGERSLRSLLAHSSGMQSEPAGSWWERSPGRTFEEVAAGLDESAAPHPPEATYHYSNVAYGLLGEVVARHRGTTWWTALRERVLEPLGMTRTSYLPEGPAATGYSVHHFANTLTPEPAQDTGAMAPAGQVWSTVEDLARYIGFLLDGDAKVLSRDTLAEMSVPQSGSAGGGLSGGYGLGLRLVAGGSGTLVGHTGSMPGFLAGLFVDRVRGTAAVVLANGTAGMRCEGLPLDLLATLEELEPTIVPAWTPNDEVPPEVAELLGVWHWGNTALGFSWEAEEVVVRQLGSGVEAYRFRPRGEGTFRGTVGYHHGETLRVVRNPDGSVNHLVCATFVYTRLPYDPSAPIPGGHPGQGLSAPG